MSLLSLENTLQSQTTPLEPRIVPKRSSCFRDTLHDSVHDGYGAPLFPAISVPTTPESSLPSPGDPKTVSACVNSFFATQSPMYSEATVTPVRELLHARPSRSPPFLPWMQSNPMFEDHLLQVGSWPHSYAVFETTVLHFQVPMLPPPKSQRPLRVHVPAADMWVRAVQCSVCVWSSIRSRGSLPHASAVGLLLATNELVELWNLSTVCINLFSGSLFFIQ